MDGWTQYTLLKVTDLLVSCSVPTGLQLLIVWKKAEVITKAKMDGLTLMFFSCVSNTSYFD